MTTNTKEMNRTNKAMRAKSGDRSSTDKSTVIMTNLEELHPDVTSPSDMSDVILMVDDKKLYACQSLLSMASPVFKDMLSTPEFKQKKTKLVPLPDKCHRAVHDMLCWLNPAIHKPVTGETAELIVPLADEFKITRLKEECQEHILTNFRHSTSCQKCVHYLQLSEKYILTQLKEALMDHLSRLRIDDLEKLDGITEVKTGTLLMIAYKRIRLMETMDTAMDLAKSSPGAVDSSSLARFSDFRHNLSTAPQTTVDEEGDDEDSSNTPRDTVTLLVEDKKITTSQTLIRAASPFFDSLLSSPFRETKNNEVMLPGKSYDAVRFMVSFVESPDVLTIIDSLLEPVLMLANEYQMGKLKNLCEQYILRDIQKIKGGPNGPNEILRYYRMAHQCNLSEVTKCATPILAKITSRGLEKYSNYCAAALQPVFQARVKLLESETPSSRR